MLTWAGKALTVLLMARENGFETHQVLVLVSHDGDQTRLGIQAISFEWITVLAPWCVIN